MATVVHTARCEEVLLDGGRALQAKAKTHTKVTHFHFQSRVILPCAMRGDNTNLR